MPTELNLQPINRENLRKVIKLELNEGETRFVAPNSYSIAQAYVEPKTTPKAICAGDEPVGFVYYGQFEEDKGEYWVCRLMTDKNHRRKGYGKRAMQLVIAELSAQEDCTKIYVSFVVGNTHAMDLYKKLDFKDTGKIEEGEVIYCLEL